MKSGRMRRMAFFGLILLFCSLIFALPAYLLFSNSKTLIVDNLAQNAVGVANTISTFLEGDFASYSALNDIDDFSTQPYDEEYYERMLTLFQEIKAGANATYVYTVKKVSETEFAYILDGEDPASELFSPPGSKGTIYVELNKAIDEDTETFSGLEYDQAWKDYLVTGFSPINDPDTGHVIGAVGVDFSYSIIVPLLNRIHNVILIGYLLIVLILSIIFYLLFESRVDALNTDYLTGLFSKRYFDRHLQFNILDTKFRNQALSLIMMDIDAFKEINDHYGHLMGDKILKAVGDIVKKSIRRSDICARYGGDEFSIILPDAEISHSLLVAERILDGMRQITLLHEGETILPVSLSIGIAEWGKEMTGDDLVNHADLALYESKKESNGKISIFDDIQKK